MRSPPPPRPSRGRQHGCGAAARSGTRAASSEKKGAANAAAARVARYDKLVEAMQAAKDAALMPAQDAWNATMAAREAVERFWATPEAPPAPYLGALNAGEAAWKACATVPGQ